LAEQSEAKNLLEEYETKKKPIDEDYQRKLSELQANCPHTKLTDWMDEWWALGHSTGYSVQHCKNCDKEIHRRTSCYICGRSIQDEEIKKFSTEMLKKAREEGKTLVLAVNGAYCANCISGHSPAPVSEVI